MIRTVLRVGLLALGLLVGCADKVVPINVTVLTKKCGTAPGPNPTDGVDHYKVRITASDIDPIERDFASGGQVPIDKIPPGKARTLTLIGYAGDPSTGNAVVKAWGQSLPFDVPANTTGSVNVTVVLRATGVFAGVSTVADETKCAALTTPRAGHTATLLADGRVLIAGGFQLRAGVTTTVDAGLDPANWNYLDTAEIFDPTTNTTKAVAAIDDKAQSYDNPVAFQTASLLNDGTVLLVGGESGSRTGSGRFARPNTMTYDPSADKWTYGYVSVPELSASDGIYRSHHIAVTDNAGRVVVLGGVHYDSNTYAPVLTPEAIWRDPSDGGWHAVTDPNTGMAFSFGRADLTGAQVLGASGIAAVGGDTLDGNLADPPVMFFQFQQGAGMQVVGPLDSNADNPKRSVAAAAPLGSDGHLLLVAGGQQSTGSAEDLTSVLDTTDSTKHSQLLVSGARLGPCAAALADGRVLVVGGELPGHQTAPTSELYVPGSTSATETVTGSLRASRVMHTCTVLKDGSVLVVGGVREEGGVFQVLDSLELYTPVPLNP